MPTHHQESPPMPIRFRPPFPVLVLTFVSFFGSAPAITAQGSGPGSDEAAVLAVVDALFDAMRARDGDAAAGLFHPEARLVVSSVAPDGSPRVQVTPAASFTASIGQPGEPLNEPIFDPEVRIDGGLANVWTFYRFYRGEEFSHCGYDSFHLVKEGDAWRIIDVAYTTRTEGCN